MGHRDGKIVPGANSHTSTWKHALTRVVDMPTSVFSVFWHSRA